MMTIPFLFSPRLVRLLYGTGSIALFGFICWYFLYRSPAPDYHEILSVLIGAQVTIVTVMFSAILVALQLASAQFSPRITRSFFRYNAVGQTAFYGFLFGIALCLGVKFTYSKETGLFAYPWMPVLAAVYAFFLMAVVLPQFVFHIADSINVAAIIRQITRRTLREIESLYGKEFWQSGDPLVHIRENPTRPALPLLAQEVGFLDEINSDRLKILAKTYSDWQFYVAPLSGNFISPGEPLLQIVPPPGQALVELPEALEKKLYSCFLIGEFRSYEQDILFGVRQLVDIAIKAISPAVNDPTTAVNCLHYLGVILSRQVMAPIPSLAIRQSPPNLHQKDFSFSMLTDLAFDQIYQWGKHDPVVVSQILAVMNDVATTADNPECLAVLQKQVSDFELDQLTFGNAEQSARVRHRLEVLEKTIGERR